ncbi:helix-turn-helix domain-containing protein [Rhodococcus hoagii]|uniref:AraC family transcriptional regulator n=1 Tax=Rhodococcus hoagii TaxID=43767 RepID=UPI0019E19C83|nr:helix-turn-helix domain-containing protein [Prescottella equi]MBM4693326.1 helix-turn-helix domain-containing protein [Prescottella equi]NKS29558.1 helix-turn-helix domain-containing protein [Prescottella equi]NKS32642.1 helix-turn-helix domain-containing protein [Prescottella equi]
MLSTFDPRTPRERGAGSVTDWDEIKQWSDAVYMPYSVRPVGRGLVPASDMFSVKIAEMTLTRFSYGIPVALSEFEPEAGNVLVLTTLNGRTRHEVTTKSSVDLRSGQTFVVDCSRVDYGFAADADHLQLNLTIPHRLLADFALRWWGRAPDDRLWRHKCVVGGPGSPWLALLDYASRTLATDRDTIAHSRIGTNLQEIIAAQVLEEWAASAGVDPAQAPAVPAPGYVRRAVRYIEDNARDLPTVAEVAQEVGVSVRALSGGFREYLGITPRDCLREHRLEGVRRELSSHATTTVAAAAGAWGYVNMGVFAAAYRQRFGENPSDTLRRGRK